MYCTCDLSVVHGESFGGHGQQSVAFDEDQDGELRVLGLGHATE